MRSRSFGIKLLLEIGLLALLVAGVLRVWRLREDRQVSGGASKTKGGFSKNRDEVSSVSEESFRSEVETEVRLRQGLLRIPVERWEVRRDQSDLVAGNSYRIIEVASTYGRIHSCLFAVATLDHLEGDALVFRGLSSLPKSRLERYVQVRGLSTQFQISSAEALADGAIRANCHSWIEVGVTGSRLFSLVVVLIGTLFLSILHEVARAAPRLEESVVVLTEGKTRRISSSKYAVVSIDHKDIARVERDPLSDAVMIRAEAPGSTTLHLEELSQHQVRKVRIVVKKNLPGKKDGMQKETPFIASCLVNPGAKRRKTSCAKQGLVLPGWE